LLMQCVPSMMRRYCSFFVIYLPPSSAFFLPSLEWAIGALQPEGRVISIIIFVPSQAVVLLTYTSILRPPPNRCQVEK